MNKKSQASMESMMSYGFAILIVLVTIGALAFFGLLSPSRFLPDKVELGTGLTVVGSTMNTTNITLIVKNSIGKNIKNLEMTLVDCDNADAISSQVDISGGKSGQLVIPCTGPIAGSKFKSKITYTYSTIIKGISLSHSGKGELFLMTQGVRGSSVATPPASSATTPPTTTTPPSSFPPSSPITTTVPTTIQPTTSAQYTTTPPTTIAGYPCDSCLTCGEGLFNVCDESECYTLGNCVFNDVWWPFPNECSPDPAYCTVVYPTTSQISTSTPYTTVVSTTTPPSTTIVPSTTGMNFPGCDGNVCYNCENIINPSFTNYGSGSSSTWNGCENNGFIFGNDEYCDSYYGPGTGACVDYGTASDLAYCPSYERNGYNAVSVYNCICVYNSGDLCTGNQEVDKYIFLDIYDLTHDFFTGGGPPATTPAPSSSGGISTTVVSTTNQPSTTVVYTTVVSTTNAPSTTAPPTTVAYGTYSVTGSLSPNAVGTYNWDTGPFINGRPAYSRNGDGAYIILWDSAAWVLVNKWTGPDYLWAGGSGSNPSGTYSAINPPFSNTGTATINLI